MKISVVIPNYNGEVLLKSNIPKLFEELKEYGQENVEVIVVDDASTDESVLSIKNFVSNIKNENVSIKILENEKNLGFSSTVNKGVSKATGEIVVLLNTDIYPQKDFLKPLIEDFKDEKVFAVGCLDKSIESGGEVLRGRGLGKWQRGFLVHRRGEIDKDNTLWVSGGSGAFRKSIWDKLGGLNELYNPFYWEDIDICYRALKSGYKILFEPRSVVIHEHEKGSIKSGFSQKEIKKIAYKNQFIFVWENATDYSLQFAHFFWLPYHFAKAIFRKDLTFFMGFFSALIILPKIILSSFTYQRTFVRKDSQVIAQIQ